MIQRTPGTWTIWRQGSVFFKQFPTNVTKLDPTFETSRWSQSGKESNESVQWFSNGVWDALVSFGCLSKAPQLEDL